MCNGWRRGFGLRRYLSTYESAAQCHQSCGAARYTHGVYEHKAGVYAIHQIGTDNFYIGSSADIPVRWLRHKRHLAKGKHYSVPLQTAWTAFGAEAFEFVILEECERDRATLAAREQEYLNTFRPSFNALSWATLSRLGSPQPLRLDLTQCPRGHLYDAANTGYTKKHQRYCRRCAADRSIAKYEHKTSFRADGPICERGHEWTPDNTRILKSGTRQCKACAAERKRTRNERTRERYNSGPELRERRRADHERHREERLAQMREHGREIRATTRAERIAAGTYRKTETCRRGHPWTPENTIQWSKKRLCRTCRDAARARLKQAG